MKAGTKILAFLTVFVLIFGGYAATPAQATSISVQPKGVVLITKWIVDHHIEGYPGTTFNFKITNTVTNEAFTGSCSGDGICAISDVPFGVYTLEETSGTAGFKFREFTNIVGSHIDTVTVGWITEPVFCWNDRAGNILITKDDGAGKRLVGATYDVYYSKCESGPWTKIGDGTTNASGEYLLSDKIFGWYKVVETGAPLGYAFTPGSPDNEVIKHIDVVNETETADFHNTQLFGSLRLTKVVNDEFSTADDPTEFSVRVVGPDNNPNVGPETRNFTIKEGVETPVDKLPFGDYTIMEETQFGYKDITGAQSVKIESEKDNPLITITNDKLFGDITVTKTITNGTAYGDTGFTIELLKNGVKVDEHTFSAADANSGTSYTFKNKEYCTDYALHEVALAGYESVADVPVKLNTPSQSYTISNTKIYGSITVNKAFDGAAPADGTKFTFQLFRDSIKVDEKELTWAAGGASVKFENLEYGWTYVVKEVPVTGYYIDSAFNVGKQVVIGGETVDAVFTCTNTMLGKIEITKTDSFNGDPLKGAEFTVTMPKGDTKTLTTGADGKATSDWLYPGKYTVQETKAPDGYAIDDSTAKTVTVTGGATAPITFTDSKGSLVVIKRSSFASQPALKGVVFQLLSADSGTGEPAAGTVLETKTTDADGMVRFDRLNVGTAYWVREKQELPGYDRVLQARRVTPKANPQLADYVTFFDNPQGTIRITKVDSADATKKLAGAVFGIYTDAECTAANLVLTMTATDANGVAVSSPLRFGGGTSATYYVKEITAPADYVLNTVAQSVTFTQAGQEASLTFTNMRNKGMLVIKKVDSLTKAALPGATFVLYTAKGGSQVGSPVTTGADGIAKFTELTPGTYYLVETAAPTNYKLPADGFEFKVEAGTAEPAAIEISNLYNPPKDISTGMMDWNILLIGGLALVAGGLIVFLTRKRKTGMAK